MVIRMKAKTFVALSITGALATAALAYGLPAVGAPKRSTKIRRTILLRFKPEASEAEIKKILKEVKENITHLKGVRNVVVGTQLIERAPFRYGISMDFDNADALQGYRQNEEHRRTHNQYHHLIEQAQITDILDE